MLHGFDTHDEPAAVGALLVYAVWRSRDKTRYKVTPDVWGQVERFTKGAAKRAATLPGFVERLMPRLSCATLQPRYLVSDLMSYRPMVANEDGEIIEVAGAEDDRREFLTRLLDETDPAPVLAALYHETVKIILLVRERIEREKPYEAVMNRAMVEEAAEWAAEAQTVIE